MSAERKVAAKLATKVSLLDEHGWYPQPEPGPLPEKPKNLEHWKGHFRQRPEPDGLPEEHGRYPRPEPGPLPEEPKMKHK